MIYKFKKWWQHLGLVLLGFFFNQTFNSSLFFFLILGGSLLAFAHTFDDKKKSCFSYLVLSCVLSIFLNISQILTVLIILILIFLYPKIKYYPISALYKGFGYSLWFLLPFESINISAMLFYLLLGFIATISEVSHEAEHFEKDKREGIFSTAILLNLKINKRERLYIKSVIISIGIFLLIYLILRR